MTIKNDLQYIKRFICDYETKKAWQDDKIKTKLNFTCFIDSLQKDNEISEKTAQNVYLYENKRHEIIMTCLSYKIKIA